jgi:D-alanyl-D-alanine dipeptidase
MSRLKRVITIAFIVMLAVPVCWRYVRIRQFFGERGLCAEEVYPEAQLIELKKVIPDIILEIKYATLDNFTGKVLYPSAECFLLPEAALALKKVQEDLKKNGLNLKVYDGYRPLSVQKKMWEVVPDANYVADPAKGSMHNRGCAVDVTLVDMEGRDVEMPTEYDNFTKKAHRDYQDLPRPAIAHRRILREAMERHGFISSTTEWWHYSFKNSKEKPVLDIPFEALKKGR